MKKPETEVWLDEEPGAGEAFADLRRLFRRAFRRPMVPIAIALCLSSAFVVRRMLRHSVSEAQVVFRAIEPASNAAFSVQSPNQQLRAYILDVAFAAPELWPLIEKYNLYPAHRKLDRQSAIEAMRDDLDVTLKRNYFLEARAKNEDGSEEERSARIAISFVHRDPVTALAVVRDLGTLVSAHEQRVREVEAGQATALIEFQLESGMQALTKALRTQSENRLEQLRATPLRRTTLEIELRTLDSEVSELERQLAGLEKKKTEADLRLALEKHALGLRFELVDVIPPHRRLLTRPTELALDGILFLLLIFPLVTMAVGALDPRVYGSGDVARLGLQPLAEVRAYASDNVGALTERLERENGVQ